MMKLFALGTTNSDPDRWMPWDEVELVQAESKEQALEICGYSDYDYSYPVAEVDMTKAQCLMKMPAYSDDDNDM